MKYKEIDDFWFAAYLFHTGVDPEEIRDFGKRKLFIFADNINFREMKRKYYQDEATVNPRRYKWGFRRLKAIITN